MAAALSLAQQLDALITRIKAQVPGLKSVVGMEDLDDAMETEELLPGTIRRRRRGREMPKIPDRN